LTESDYVSPFMNNKRMTIRISLHFFRDTSNYLRKLLLNDQMNFLIGFA